MTTVRKLAEHEEIVAQRGALRFRATHESDAPRLSLNDTWKFRFSPTATRNTTAFAEPTFDAAKWDELPVPSHWVLHGYGKPAYQNIKFPIPVNAPYVPTENPTGDYRYEFSLPSDWPSGGKNLVRFEGVESWCKVWLNGKELGTSTGSRLPVEFDASALVAGTNVLAVRVHQWSSGTWVEDQDQWWLPGIFRDVTVIHRPAGAVEDHFVHMSYDHTTGSGTLRVDSEPAGRVTIPELGIDSPTGVDIAVKQVEPWTAESPRLYQGVLDTGREGVAGERVQLKIGFRTVKIEDRQIKVNGRRILIRGVDRHEFHPKTGRALDRQTMLDDILLMKRHNINAVRTSHYPPHPHFLDLCDEYGLWVMDEGDFETHGFEQCEWRNNPTDSPLWTDVLVNRTLRMLERDKNHPSIIIWSIGNEGGFGENVGHMAEAIRGRDRSRPIHYERDLACKYVDFYSRMYASPGLVEKIGKLQEGVKDETARLDFTAYTQNELDKLESQGKRRNMPFVQCEYAHAMGNGPGSLGDYMRLYEQYPRCQGGFIWEWIDHGLLQHTADGRPYFAYGGDFGEVIHDGNFVCDGLIFPDRTPSPGMIEYKKVIEPVTFTRGSDGGLAVRSKYDFADLSHLAFTWAVESAGKTVAEGTLDVPAVKAGETATIPFPKVPAGLAGEAIVTVKAALVRQTLWADAGHEVAWSQFSLTPDAGATAKASAAAGPAVAKDGDNLIIGAATLSADGTLLKLAGLDVEGGLSVNIWRATTDNDRRGDYRQVPPVWIEAGLDRMTHRVDAVDVGDTSVVVRSRIAAANTDRALLATYTWNAAADGAAQLDIAVTPEGDWDGIVLPRLGVNLGLPGSLGAVEWFGCGPGEAYPDSRDAAKVGQYALSIDDMQTPYVYPQENGSRIDVRWAEIRDIASGAGLRVEGATNAPLFALTARRWTTTELEAAHHATDLVPGKHVWVDLDKAHGGLGSASCGPAPLPQYLLHPEKTSFGFTFRPVSK